MTVFPAKGTRTATKGMKHVQMRKLIGYTMFWIAAGMVVELFIESILISILLILFFLLLGYNLFL